ncbi:MAG: copper resistance protein NlpE N-terminal domain-containing protein [Thermomonas sp.]
MLPMRALATCALLTLFGCDVGKPTSMPAQATSGTTSGLSSGMEFSGERSCVDCDGIESWLRLEQAGAARRYRMVEVYYGQQHERRFEDSGDWSTQDDLLRLRSSQGGERVYSRMQDGFLHARGAHGQDIPAAEDEVLEPAGFDSTR